MSCQQEPWGCFPNAPRWAPSGLLLFHQISDCAVPTLILLILKVIWFWFQNLTEFSSLAFSWTDMWVAVVIKVNNHLLIYSSPILPCKSTSISAGGLQQAKPRGKSGQWFIHRSTDFFICLHYLMFFSLIVSFFFFPLCIGSALPHYS